MGVDYDYGYCYCGMPRTWVGLVVAVRALVERIVDSKSPGDATEALMPAMLSPSTVGSSSHHQLAS